MESKWPQVWIMPMRSTKETCQYSLARRHKERDLQMSGLPLKVFRTERGVTCPCCLALSCIRASRVRRERWNFTRNGQMEYLMAASKTPNTFRQPIKTYAGVVSRESVRKTLSHMPLPYHGLDVCAADIRNAYLTSTVVAEGSM